VIKRKEDNEEGDTKKNTKKEKECVCQAKGKRQRNGEEMVGGSVENVKIQALFRKDRSRKGVVNRINGRGKRRVGKKEKINQTTLT